MNSGIPARCGHKNSLIGNKAPFIGKASSGDEPRPLITFYSDNVTTISSFDFTPGMEIFTSAHLSSIALRLLHTAFGRNKYSSIYGQPSVDSDGDEKTRLA